jgi:prepilin-type N-terminal cleavage/methylation domain-containing protein
MEISVSIKKGFTLIEVVVALGILTTVLTGTITLVSKVVDLQIAARSRSEATAIAQGEMSKRLTLAQQGCTTDFSTVDGSGAIGRFTYLVTHYSATNFNNVSDADFVTINVRLTWNSRNRVETLDLNQTVRQR